MLKTTVSRSVLAAALLASPSVALAQSTSGEEVVVTATRASGGIPRDQLGSSVTIIQPVDLELRQARIVSDILRDIPGVSVSRSGTVGGLTAVRMRGAEGNHTLVLIDGLDASDPVQGEFDFSALIADEVARVEVLRGQQSALYGSDAIGGVIHYQTLSGAAAPGIGGRVEAGSFGSLASAVRIAGVEDGFDYAVSGSFASTDGVPTSRFGTRELGAENAAVSGRFTYDVSENFRLRAVARYVNTEADFNSADFNFTSPTYGLIIDGTGHYEYEAAYGLIAADLSFLDGAWDHSLTLQGADTERDTFEGGAITYGSYKGSRVKLSYVTAYEFTTGDVSHTITGAVDHKVEKYTNKFPQSPFQRAEQEIENTGFVAQYTGLIGENIGLGAAIRYDENDLFKNATTYRLQASYKFDFGLRLHAAGGTGIKNPTFTELYGYDPGSFEGNPNLRPERSEGWEIGLEYTFLDEAARIDVTYFNSTLEDEIRSTFPPPTYIETPVNLLTESEQRGVEVSAQALISEGWRVFATYTYVDAEENGLQEIRRAPHSGSVNVSYVDPGDLFSGTLTVRRNGEMDDTYFSALGSQRVTLDAFTLVNLAGDVRVSDDVRVYARIENLFDEEYEEVFSYRTAGRAFYAGIRAGF